MRKQHDLRRWLEVSARLVYLMPPLYERATVGLQVFSHDLCAGISEHIA